jgi:hypothetical protein
LELSIDSGIPVEDRQAIWSRTSNPAASTPAHPTPSTRLKHGGTLASTDRNIRLSVTL